MTASPAADWLPCKGRPDLPDGTQCFVRDMYSGELGPLRIELWQWGPITHYRLAAPHPAQPADNKWFLGMSAKECHDDRSNRRLSASPHNNREWRYPPGERAEATINAAGQAPCIYDDRPEAQTHSLKTSARATPAKSREDSDRSKHLVPVQPVPAAPQRQNLALWLALRGRAPWPKAERVILSSLPVSAFKEWK